MWCDVGCGVGGLVKVCIFHNKKKHIDLIINFKGYNFGFIIFCLKMFVAALKEAPFCAILKLDNFFGSP